MNSDLSTPIPTVKLKGGTLSQHPWVFGMHLDKNFGPGYEKISNGSIAKLCTPDGRCLAMGSYNGHARIGFRVLACNSSDIQMTHSGDFRQWLRKTLLSSVEFRRGLMAHNHSTNACRIINSEGDGLSGLVADLYGDHLVLQFYSSTMYYLRESIVGFLSSTGLFKSWSYFAEDHVQKQESFQCHPSSEATSTEIREHGIKYHLRFDLKHKTGFYSDQRDARYAIAELSENKIVADLCAFNGGFALNAAIRGKAAKVYAVELDPAAAALAKTNFELNAAEIELHIGDALEFCDRHPKAFDVVVFDPPKQLRDAREKDRALRRYAEMNQRVLKSIAPGGILLTCSCSGLVSRTEFSAALRKAAQQAGRDLSVFRWTGAGADHPVNIQMPEGEYLKVAWCLVR